MEWCGLILKGGTATNGVCWELLSLILLYNTPEYRIYFVSDAILSPYTDSRFRCLKKVD